MSGFFTLGEIKDRPGVYKRYENLGTESTGATEKIAACVVSGNWGPLNQAVRVDNVSFRGRPAAVIDLRQDLVQPDGHKIHELKRLIPL